MRGVENSEEDECQPCELGKMESGLESSPQMVVDENLSLPTTEMEIMDNNVDKKGSNQVMNSDGSIIMQR